MAVHWLSHYLKMQKNSTILRLGFFKNWRTTERLYFQRVAA
jgi:hypothetical protein